MALKWFKKNKDQSDKREKKSAEEVPELEDLDDPQPEYQEPDYLEAADEEDEELTDEMIEKMLEDELGVAAEDDFETETAGDAAEVLEAEETAEIEELDAAESEYQEQNALRGTEEEPEDEDEELTDEMIEKMLEDELGVADDDDFDTEIVGDDIEVPEEHDAVEIADEDEAVEVADVQGTAEISAAREAVEVVEADAVAEDGAASDDTPDKREKDGYFKRLRGRLFKSRKSLSGGFDSIFTGKTKIDDDLLEELEELLITSDIGVQTSINLIERIAKAKVKDVDQLKAVLKEEILSILDTEAEESRSEFGKPHVILVIGVNGVGKTTTIGKLAASAHAAGQKVLIAAADTFRAAAVEQLGIWAERAHAEFVRHRENADPAAVAFDAVAAATARGCDLVLIDTAGRLHTKVNLMEELKKIKRTVAKQMEGAPHEILLVLDATTGQNALSQAQMFDEALNISGLVLTKLDGTAKGGIVIAICSALKIPLQYIGIGEQIDDLRPFDAKQFIDALL